MEIVFDPAKDKLNKKAHRISLSRAADFDFEAAYLKIDDRQDYGEVRYRAISFLGAILYVLIFTESSEGTLRAISLRKAERREAKEYADQ